MAERPTLETERLVLRPFTLEDAPDTQRLAGAWEIADTTLMIPHPYEDGMAEAWIGTHQETFDRGRAVLLAVTRRDGGELVGSIGLTFAEGHAQAELGYWIGKPWWNMGYATEASRALLRYGFEHRRLNRVHAHHFARNPASGRVMEKLGMKPEGCLRQHVRRWGRFEDLVLYGMLAREYEEVYR